MKIKISDSIKSSLSDDEYKYLILLQAHIRFGVEVKKIRAALGILTLDDGEILAPQNKIPDLKSMSEKVWELMQLLKIPSSLQGSIENIIQWGEVFEATLPFLVLNIEHRINRKILYTDKILPRPPKGHPMLLENWYLNNQDALSTIGSIAPAYPLLQIGKKTNITQFKKEVTANWSAIEAAMDDFEKSVPFPTAIRQFRTKDMETGVKIFLLKNRDIPYDKIKGILEADNIFLEVNSITKRFGYIKKLLLDLGFISEI